MIPDVLAIKNQNVYTAQLRLFLGIAIRLQKGAKECGLLGL